MDRNKEIWQRYYQTVLSKPHHTRTEFAANLNQSGVKRAVDCGCGTGADIAYLHTLGYQVSGFDLNVDAIEICAERFSGCANIDVTECGFDDFSYPPVGLLLANHSLYFADPNSWHTTWQNMKNSIVPGGVFAGDLMGVKDSWADDYGSTRLPLKKEQLEAMFIDFDVVRWLERDEEGKTSLGKTKHWHTYSVVAIKG